MIRRRFIAITASALATPLQAKGGPGMILWQGQGFGAALSLRLAGVDPLAARRMFLRVEREIARIEGLFSLHRDSALTRLNRDGRLDWPAEDMAAILHLSRRVHQATGGAFDPTVQALWQAVAAGSSGQDLLPLARRMTGFDRVNLADHAIRLDYGQALTLNGVAQGWAADRIAALLRAGGFGRALVDMGEIAALGTPAPGSGWDIGMVGPDGTLLARTRLTDRALATSSPRGTLIGDGQPHILGPQGQSPIWQTVCVSAPQAAVADALSTAFCLMDLSAIEKALAAFPGARLEHLA
jgi:thiamine biosynthesis lipoprotein